MTTEDKVKIHVLRCGTISVSNDAVYGKSFFLPSVRAFAPLKTRLSLPVFCFLVEHPKGRVLVDAGFCRAVSPGGVFSASASAAALSPSLAAFFRPFVPPGEAIGEQLLALGLSPSDLDAVLLTHLDADHVSGLRDLSSAKRHICSQEDYWWSCRSAYSHRQPKKLWLSDNLETFWYKGTDIGPSIWSYDFFGDGTFILVHFPGHTEGQFGVLLRREGRFVLLTSDAAFDRRSWEELRVPGFGFNPIAQRKCLEWINAKSLERGCLAVLSSHDPALSPCVIEL